MRLPEALKRWWSWAVLAAFAGLGVAISRDIVLQKCVALLLLPAGLVWLGLALVAVVAWRRGQRGLAGAIAALWLLYALAGNVWVGKALLGSLEAQVPAVDPAAGPPFEAVFVLGGGTETDAADVPLLGAGGDRVAIAARLWHQGRAKHLVASGCTIAGTDIFRDLGRETATLWRGLGIPEDAIEVVPPGPINTTQEIAAYRTLLAARGWTRVGLVTSGWHLPRALALCRRAGLSMVPIMSDCRGRQPGWSLLYLIPQERGFVNVHLGCWEYLGRLIGR
jgi:uncharacterized SAM-binding protein YcdF (DUF218 family)